MHIKYNLPANRLNALKAAAAAKLAGKDAPAPAVAPTAGAAVGAKSASGSGKGSNAGVNLSSLLGKYALAVQTVPPVIPAALSDMAAASTVDGKPILDGTNHDFTGTATEVEGLFLPAEPPPRDLPKEPVTRVKFPLFSDPDTGDGLVLLDDGTYRPFRRVTLS